jgi:hypothetical protein
MRKLVPLFTLLILSTIVCGCSVFIYAAEISSPNIRIQWMSKATGIGDWLTNPQTPSTIWKAPSGPTSYGPGGDFAVEVVGRTLAYYAAVLAAGAYTIVYLPFAVPTGAVAGEIDAYEWRACMESFLQKIKEADPANVFVQTLTNNKTNLIRINNPKDFIQTAAALDLKHVLEFNVTEIGLQTCKTLGGFSLNIVGKARG